jgi:hypothetical protein
MRIIINVKLSISLNVFFIVYAGAKKLSSSYGHFRLSRASSATDQRENFIFASCRLLLFFLDILEKVINLWLKDENGLAI